jgi:hypothetical protein
MRRIPFAGHDLRMPLGAGSFLLAQFGKRICTRFLDLLQRPLGEPVGYRELLLAIGTSDQSIRAQENSGGVLSHSDASDGIE